MSNEMIPPSTLPDIPPMTLVDAAFAKRCCPLNGADRDIAAARRQAIVDVARDRFFENGYAGTTMNSIAAAVGGSKTTLWSYFPSKEDLFNAVVDDLIARYSEALRVELPLDGEVRSTLHRFMLALIRTLMSEPMLSLQRLVISEATRFPELLRAFHARGPTPGRARVMAFISAAMERGVLRRGDVELATTQLKALASANLHQCALLNLPHDRSPEAVLADVDNALDAFMRLWAAE